MASEPTKKTGIKCPTDGCNGHVRARGFCVTCYYRHLRSGLLKKGQTTEKFKHRISNVDEESMLADCSTCGKVKVFNRGKGRYRCSIDSNNRSRTYKEAYRQSRKMLLKKECQICGSNDKLCYDHCHETNEFRGTLCGRCNVAIGLLKENTSFMKNAIDYLNEFNFRMRK